ncbi:RNA polymerase sigma factor SigV [Gottschalkia purinilytica]|uniref:RNA polymerase sigma factor SigV n=1 Tax=Gottschalkia purinilytica TaxID=1503 RepID=A0A0L0W7R5_GOTPU|nr:sigma-70 family RNA polymerase sigma factor [Gottschalkia purinilytica]KNF07618.1 RNA polymerase sigma factor SigV [Gottschalkia purinilytica]
MRKKDLEKIVIDYILENKENCYRLAYSYVKNVDDALDIVQESTYKAVTSLNSLKEPKYIKTWFYRIIVNTSLDFLRKQKKVDIVSEEILDVYSHGVDDVYENIDLQRELDNLPPNYRIIVILRYFEDLKIEEIADILKENTSTVKTRLYSALKKLRISMKD